MLSCLLHATALLLAATEMAQILAYAHFDEDVMPDAITFRS